ncbi:MAG: signal peptide peptidase SppA, partial [Bacteroidales bacterium]|nr:signal peptide peptidase SppA [Bacteroidales bacterium]
QISEALSLTLIDQSFYKDGLVDYFCTLQSVKSEKQLRILRMSTYISAKPIPKAKAKVALLFANGSLHTGTGQQDIMSDNYIQTIRRLRADSSVKAVVLRVSSPGGDARAAAIIHRELQLLKEQKPLVISVGDEAASGGYWISCAGDHIFASPTSLTGSIGAYAIAYNGQKGLNKWLKVNAETVKTHSSSDMGSIYRPMTSLELARIQQDIDQTYQHFVETVATGRERPYQEIDALAQGKIWSGIDAYNHQLIDKIGGLTDAIAYAADLAGLGDYQVVEPMSKGSLFERLMQSSAGTQNRFWPGTNPADWAGEVERVLRQAADRGVQTKLPFVYTLDY